MILQCTRKKNRSPVQVPGLLLIAGHWFFLPIYLCGTPILQWVNDDMPTSSVDSTSESRHQRPLTLVILLRNAQLK